MVKYFANIVTPLKPREGAATTPPPPPPRPPCTTAEIYVCVYVRGLIRLRYTEPFGVKTLNYYTVT